MGSFVGAEKLNTEKFSESWEKIDSLLQYVPKDRPGLTFCTGGIRCVKVNSYLIQKLGFSNVGRLQDGIIGYERWLKNTTEESLFQGKNFLFDRRRLS